MECEHNKVVPKDIGDKAFCAMTVEEVKKFYPRFDGMCPDCGWHGILYASFAHYIAGDW